MPVLKNDLIFGYSAPGEGGQNRVDSAVPGKHGYGSIVDAGSALFLLTPAGNLVAFEPSDKEFKQLASYKVAESDTKRTR